MIQSIALFSLCLAPQFDFEGSDRSRSEKPVAKVVENKVPAELVVFAKLGDGDPSSTTISVSSINVPRVKLDFFRVDVRSQIRTIAFNQGRVPNYSGRAVKTVAVTAPATAKKSRSMVSFQKDLKVTNLAPGYYVVKASGSGVTDQTLVTITNLNVLAKKGRTRTLVWVTNASTGRTENAARVELFDSEGRPVSVAKTNAEGVAWIPTSVPGSKPRAILVQAGKNESVLLHTAPYPEEPRCHVQTDRPVYRPGNEVKFKAIFRDPNGASFKTPVGKRIHFEFRDPLDEVLQKGTLTTNSFGSAAGTIEIPDDGILGNYSLVLAYGTHQYYQTVSCLAYRKPQFKLTTKPLSKVYGGEKATLQVKAEYLFAAPLPNAAISYTVRRERRTSSPRPLSAFEDPGQENQGVSDAYGEDEFIANGTARTDREGMASITFPTKKDGSDSKYEIAIIATDATNRQAEAVGTVEVPAAVIRVNISSSVQATSLGEQIPIALEASTPEGKPRAAVGVLTATQQVWNEKLGRDVTQTIYKKSVQIPNSGKLTVNTLASRQGPINYSFEVKDSEGRKSVVETEIEVYGPLPFEEKDLNPTIVAAMSKDTLKLGEKASVLVTTNVRKGPILFTLEGSDLSGVRVFQPSAKGVKVPLTATKAMQPGVTIMATQSTRFNFLSDQASVAIPANDEKLTVRIRPQSKTVRPGDKTALTVETFDSSGKPTSAELSLKVIDSAIYQIKGENVLDPFSVLWGPRSNQVETTYASARELSGGMFQAANLAAVPMSAFDSLIKVRRNFQDTAFWDAFVTTNKSGKAEVSVTLPDNLTTWRATAVGITTSSKAGMSSESIIATQPFTLRIATPRQIVAGDKLDLTASINNRTEVASDLKVSIDIDMDGVKSRIDSAVSVPPKGEETFTFPLNVPLEVKRLGANVIIRGEAKQVGGSEGDAVQEVVPLVPAGVSRRTISAGAFETTVELTPNLPATRLKGLDDFKLTVWAGVLPVVLETTLGDFDQPGWNPPTLAFQIESLARLPKTAGRTQFSALFNRLSAAKSSTGWGWWPESPGNSEVTTEVAYALGSAQKAGVTVPERLRAFASSVLRSMLSESGVPEIRALVLSSLALLEPAQTGILVDFAKDLKDVSPYAKSRVAEVLLVNGKGQEAQKILSQLAGFVSDSGGKANLPGGAGPAWNAGTTETTAQYLHALCLAKAEKPLRTRLTQWLLAKAKETYGGRPKAALVRALTSYEALSPSASGLGDVRVSVNGSQLEGIIRPSGAFLASGSYPEDGGKVTVQTTAKGEVFYALESRFFDPTASESQAGIRVLRRFEVMNEAGQWVELNRDIRVNEPVRVSVVAWSDGLSEPVRITEPIPAGFEYADGDLSAWAHEEIRDGAVVHTLVVGDLPLFFRYYLRAESPGTVQALPAILEVLRRGDAAGQSSSTSLKIQANPKNQ